MRCESGIYIYHFDTSDQRKPQGYILCIALTTTAFDTEAVIKHQFPLIVYIELLKGTMHRELFIREAVQVYDVIINKLRHC